MVTFATPGTSLKQHNFSYRRATASNKLRDKVFPEELKLKLVNQGSEIFNETMNTQYRSEELDMKGKKNILFLSVFESI